MTQPISKFNRYVTSSLEKQLSLKLIFFDCYILYIGIYYCYL